MPSRSPNWGERGQGRSAEVRGGHGRSGELTTSQRKVGWIILMHAWAVEVNKGQQRLEKVIWGELINVQEMSVNVMSDRVRKGHGMSGVVMRIQ